MADELIISKEPIRQNLHEDLWNREICAEFVPHRLTDEQKQQRRIPGQGFSHTCKGSPNFLY
jgi:hypothetical protein